MSQTEEKSMAKRAKKPTEWVIKFRDGTYFHSLEAGEGGSKQHAKKFESDRAARDFIMSYQWLERAQPSIERFEEDERV